MSHIETNIGDMAVTVNKLVNAHDDHTEENNCIKDKLADIEDR